jgi:hypothetical protein
MRLWPEWAERTANKPPRGIPPRIWRFDWRVTGMQAVFGLVFAGFMVLAALILLALVVLDGPG